MRLYHRLLGWASSRGAGGAPVDGAALRDALVALAIVLTAMSVCGWLRG